MKNCQQTHVPLTEIPRCPFCNSDMVQIGIAEIEGLAAKYACPLDYVIVGIPHGRVSWQGKEMANIQQHLCRSDLDAIAKRYRTHGDR